MDAPSDEYMVPHQQVNPQDQVKATNEEDILSAPRALSLEVRRREEQKTNAVVPIELSPVSSK